MKTSSRILLCICLLASFTAALAQESEPIPNTTINNRKIIGIGTNNILDTYLSAEEYTGMNLRYYSHTEREKEKQRWTTIILHEGQLSYAENRAKNSNELLGMYHFGYGCNFKIPINLPNISVKTGATADLRLGMLYNTRNGNNPAQAKLSLEITPRIEAQYQFQLFKIPLKLNYELAIPLAGIMFSPHYGQSYYEIFSKGDYDHNINFTYPGNAPSLFQTASIEFSIKTTAIRLGYMGEIQQAKVNGIKMHQYTNAMMIGFVKRFKLIKMKP